MSYSQPTKSNTQRYRVDTQATYSCNEGYALLGIENVQCNLYGRWTNNPPVCNLGKDMNIASYFWNEAFFH